MKTCTLCKITKDLTDYSKKTSYFDGFSPWCKPCKKLKDKEQYLKNKDKRKAKSNEYYNINRDKVLAKRQENKAYYKLYNKQWKLEKAFQISEYHKNYLQEHKEEIRLQRQGYRKDNRDKINEYSQTKLKNDPHFRLARMLRKRLNDFLKHNGRKFGKRKSEEYLGCSIEDLRKHIECQFKPGMSWENHGNVWHLDHKIPLASAKTEDQLYELAKWSNLQPLFKEENLQKNSSIPNGIAWQKLQRDRLLIEDIKNGMPIDIKAKNFDLSVESFNNEHKKFIERYEWLGSCGFGVRKVFTARHNGLLGGVVLLAEPNSYQFDKKLEALIQRGACASWTPKNLGSRLVMFACKWMINNTSKRIFTAYSDPEAGEIGTIYQACNFDYLGQIYGSDSYFKLPTGKLVTKRHFTRTSSMKKWAKELNIEWQPEWLTPSGFQKRSAIPNDIKVQLDEYAYNQYKDLPKVKKSPKGKYVLLLTNKREKVEKTWIPLPYPKRK